MISNGEERSNLEIKDKWKNLIKKHGCPEEVFKMYLGEDDNDLEERANLFEWVNEWFMKINFICNCVCMYICKQISLWLIFPFQF